MFMTFLLGLFRLRSISLTAYRLSLKLSNRSFLLFNAQSFLKKEGNIAKGTKAQALTALPSSFGLVWWVWFGLAGLVW